MIRSVVIIICGLAMTVFAGECALAKPAAGGPPQLDIKATCKRAQPVSGETSAFDSCMNDEKGAQAELAKSWSTFKAGPRAICVQETKIGGAPSYVELITCLEMSKAASNLPPDLDNSGPGSGR